MKTNIIVDSCCDIPANMQKEHGIKSAPFTIRIDGKALIDDETIDVNKFTTEMLHCTSIFSKSPSSSDYFNCLKKDCTNFIVTLSGKLSGSYSAAMDAKENAEKEGYDVHVFDTASASAGQLLITIKLIELISADLKKSEIILLMNKYIMETKTYGSCHDLTNLIENGKISNLKRKILTALRIRPILGIDDNGEIGIFSNARGNKQTISRLVKLIKNSEKTTHDENAVITHCNNLDLAERLKDRLKQTFKFKKIIITNTNGVSSMHLNNKGIMLAF